jgi:signal transduction histidine kinase
VAVLCWRRFPLVALGLGIGLVAADLWLAGPLVVLAFLVGRYAASARLVLWTFAGLTCLGAVAAAVGHPDPWMGLYVVTEVLFGGVFPWLVGRYRRQRRALVLGGWERAAQLERAQAGAMEQARLRERARIAQDMHDVLGHELSLLALRAGALELDPSLEVRQRAIAGELRAGAATATERLREVVGVLGAAPASLQPFDESVTALAERSRAAGLRVSLEVSAVGELPPLADRAVYRVVQEGLTNAARHASGEPVSVRVAGSDTEVAVTIANPCSGPPGRPGSGLIGLAERVRLAGGTFTAAPEAGRFVLRAAVPRSTPAVPVDTPVPAGPVPGELAEATQRTRRGLALAVGVPIVAAIGLVGVVVGGYAIQIWGSVLPPADAARLHPGQRASDLNLPLLQLGERPDVVEPAVPEGASCRYYGTSRRLFYAQRDVFRLCFADERLVSVDFIQGEGPRRRR